jgi:hypothetical protein
MFAGAHFKGCGDCYSWQKSELLKSREHTLVGLHAMSDVLYYELLYQSYCPVFWAGMLETFVVLLRCFSLLTAW